MKNIISRLIFVAAALLPETAVASTYQSVVVLRHDGSSFAVQGEKGISLTVDGLELKFINSRDQYMSFPLSEVKGLEYSDKTGSSQWSSADAPDIVSAVVVTRNAGSLSLSNLPDNTRVMLTSLSGVTVYALNASGSCTLPLSELQPGVYLITYGATTLKIAISR